MEPEEDCGRQGESGLKLDQYVSPLGGQERIKSMQVRLSKCS